MNDEFNDKDEKYREWTTQERREKKAGMAVMVPLIISHDGAVHRETVRRWKSFAPDVEVDWVRMAQCPPLQCCHCREVLQQGKLDV